MVLPIIKYHNYSLVGISWNVLVLPAGALI